MFGYILVTNTLVLNTLLTFNFGVPRFFFFYCSALSQVCVCVFFFSLKDSKYPAIDSACGSESERERVQPIVASACVSVFIPAVQQQIKIQVDIIMHANAFPT